MFVKISCSVVGSIVHICFEPGLFSLAINERMCNDNISLSISLARVAWQSIKE